MPSLLSKVLLSKAVNVSVFQEAQNKYFTWLGHAEMESEFADAILFSLR
jgi:hypothetical protein